MKNSVLQFAISLMISVTTSVASAQAVLIEDGDSAKASQSISASQPEFESFSGAAELKKNRLIGAGAVIGGVTGQIGLNIEYNYLPTDSFLFSYGGGDGYDAWALGWKRVFTGNLFTPYFSAGIARWASVGEGTSGRTSPSLLSEQFLTAEEKRSGSFAKVLATPTAGLQFYQLEGPYTGATFYTEVIFLHDIGGGKTAATGALGAMYYF
ncbi:MAG: hypothetical protein AB7O96_04765 [Pseudobdellovibrionaceae bacterium]